MCAYILFIISIYFIIKFGICLAMSVKQFSDFRNGPLLLPTPKSHIYNVSSGFDHMMTLVIVCQDFHLLVRSSTAEAWERISAPQDFQHFVRMY